MCVCVSSCENQSTRIVLHLLGSLVKESKASVHTTQAENRVQFSESTSDRSYKEPLTEKGGEWTCDVRRSWTSIYTTLAVSTVFCSLTRLSQSAQSLWCLETEENYIMRGPERLVVLNKLEPHAETRCVQGSPWLSVCVGVRARACACGRVALFIRHATRICQIVYGASDSTTFFQTIS
jgi:hypothetical protein